MQQTTAARPGQLDPAAAKSVIVHVSPVIERDFKRRDVFPELRLENASRVINGATGVHRVSLDRAREIVADAQAQLDSRGLPRGLPVAYSSLVCNTKDALRAEARRGLIDDPGMEEAQRQQVAASACFSVGERVLYFDPRDEYGFEATIAGEYRMRCVLSDDGSYITRDDQRIEYRPGYVIKLKGADIASFAPAYALTRDDCKPSHLRLVS